MKLGHALIGIASSPLKSQVTRAFVGNSLAAYVSDLAIPAVDKPYLPFRSGGSDLHIRIG